MPCELFCNWCCFTFPSKVFRAPFIEAKDLFLHEVLFLLMFSIDAQLEFCQGRGESHFLSHIKTIDVCWSWSFLWGRCKNWLWEIVSWSILTCYELILFAGYQPDFQQYYWHLWVLCYIAGFVGGSNWSCRWRQTASNRGMLWRNGRGMKC